MVLQSIIILGALVCAFEAIRVKRLLISALWLAGTSALVALLIFLLGAPEVAVIELSVGAGLVTVLFVFAINIAGEESLPIHRVVPKPLAWGLVALSLILVGWLILPRQAIAEPIINAIPFARMLWELRGLDMLLQVILIFSGVLGVIGLLAEPRSSNTSHPEVKP
jgi:uncharacterized MnhB-related membrane protein